MSALQKTSSPEIPTDVALLSTLRTRPWGWGACVNRATHDGHNEREHQRYARMVILPPGTPTSVASRLRRMEGRDIAWRAWLLVLIMATLTAGILFDAPTKYWLFALATAAAAGIFTVAYHDRAKTRTEAAQYGQYFVIECKVFDGDFRGPDQDLASQTLLALLELDSLPEGSLARDELWTALYGRIAALSDIEQRIAIPTPDAMKNPLG